MVEDWRADSACRMNGHFIRVRRQPCRPHARSLAVAGGVLALALGVVQRAVGQCQPVLDTAATRRGRNADTDAEFHPGVACRAASSRCRRTRSATCIASTGAQSRSSTTNSSPPSRAGVSPGRATVRNVAAICRSTSSPARWPCESLMRLKSSTSSISRQAKPPWPCARSSACCARRIRKPRLASSTSGSIRLRRCSWRFCDLTRRASCQLRMLRPMPYTNRNGTLSMIVRCEVTGW